VKYTIEVPNKLYSGVTEGVPFVNGVATVEDEKVRDILVINYGYTDATPKSTSKTQSDTNEPKPEAADKPTRKSSAK